MHGVLSFTCVALAGRALETAKPVATAALLLRNCRRPIVWFVFIIVRFVFAELMGVFTESSLEHGELASQKGW
jgi:hypothetical protein